MWGCCFSSDARLCLLWAVTASFSRLSPRRHLPLKSSGLQLNPKVTALVHVLLREGWDPLSSLSTLYGPAVCESHVCHLGVRSPAMVSWCSWVSHLSSLSHGLKAQATDEGDGADAQGGDVKPFLQEKR